MQSPIPASARPRWMIVDDDAQSLELIAELLRAMVEVEISAFSEPRSALRACFAEPAAFELVITDLNMPGLDGAALTCALLAHAPDLRVILCTGSCRALSPADARGTRLCRRAAQALPGVGTGGGGSLGLRAGAGRRHPCGMGADAIFPRLFPRPV